MNPLRAEIIPKSHPKEKDKDITADEIYQKLCHRYMRLLNSPVTSNHDVLRFVERQETFLYQMQAAEEFVLRMLHEAWEDKDMTRVDLCEKNLSEEAPYLEAYERFLNDYKSTKPRVSKIIDRGWIKKNLKKVQNRLKFSA